VQQLLQVIPGGPVINETTKEVIGLMVQVAGENISTNRNTPTPPPPEQIIRTAGFALAYKKSRSTSTC
jgi:hypothetical protein